MERWIGRRRVQVCQVPRKQHGSSLSLSSLSTPHEMESLAAAHDFKGSDVKPRTRFTRRRQGQRSSCPHFRQSEEDQQAKQQQGTTTRTIVEKEDGDLSLLIENEDWYQVAQLLICTRHYFCFDSVKKKEENVFNLLVDCLRKIKRSHDDDEVPKGTLLAMILIAVHHNHRLPMQRNGNHNDNIDGSYTSFHQKNEKAGFSNSGVDNGVLTSVDSCDSCCQEQHATPCSFLALCCMTYEEACVLVACYFCSPQRSTQSKLLCVSLLWNATVVLRDVTANPAKKEYQQSDNYASYNITSHLLEYLLSTTTSGTGTGCSAPFHHTAPRVESRMTPFYDIRRHTQQILCHIDEADLFVRPNANGVPPQDYNKEKQKDGTRCHSNEDDEDNDERSSHVIVITAATTIHFPCDNDIQKDSSSRLVTDDLVDTETEVPACRLRSNHARELNRQTTILETGETSVPTSNTTIEEDLCIKEEQHQQQVPPPLQRNNDSSSMVVRGGDAAANYISNAAMWIDDCLECSGVPLLTKSLDAVGEFAKAQIPPKKKTVNEVTTKTTTTRRNLMGDRRNASSGKDDENGNREALSDTTAVAAAATTTKVTTTCGCVSKTEDTNSVSDKNDNDECQQHQQLEQRVTSNVEENVLCPQNYQCDVDVDDLHVGDTYVLPPPPVSPPLLLSKRAIVVLTYSNAAKRATAKLDETVQFGSAFIRDTAQKGMEQMAQSFESQEWGETVVPSHSREVLVAVAKVSIASLGATVIVTGAVWKVTNTVTLKTAYLTADVVRHRYGHVAGKVVEDAADAYMNVTQAMQRARGWKSGEAAVRNVAKHTARVLVLEESR